MANKLTDRTIFGASLASGDLMHIVDIDDVSQDPSGSSYKLPIGTLATYILTGAPIQSANNGLTLSGTTIKWGGALTANTVISGAKTLDFTNLTYFYSNNGNGTTNGWLYNDPAYAGFGWDAASGNILEAFTDGTQLSLHAVNGLNNAKFTLNVPSAAVTNNGTNNVFIINDSIESKGLVYAGDYTANFTPESLITKRFVTASYVPYTGATSNLNMGNHNVSFGSTYGIDTSAAPGTLSIGVTNANVINYGNSGTTTHNFSGTIPTGTLANGIKVLLGSDVKGDLYYNGGSGVLARLGAGTNAYVLTSNGPGNAPSWQAAATGGTILGSIAATAGLIPYGTGVANTVTSSANLSFDGTQLSVRDIVIGRGGGAAGENTIIGVNSFQSNSGTINTAFGYIAGRDNTSGANNVFVGGYTGLANTSSSNNTFIGGQAGVRIGMGNCTFVGAFSGYENTSTNNSYFGINSGRNGVGGAGNTFGGAYSGYTNTSGSLNVYLGYQAGYYETGSNKLFIDNAQRASEADGRIKALIYGIFDASPSNQSLTINGQLNIAIGSVSITTAGGGYLVKEGSNATMGTGTLVGGTVTIATTKVTANSRIFLTDTGGGVIANIGSLYISAKTANTSFAVSSSNALDTSTFNWIIFEPA